MADQNKPHTADTLERVLELGPYIQDLELLGIHAPMHGVYRMVSRPVWDLLQKALPSSLEGCSVLDIGCNSGLFAFLLKRMGAGPVSGLDLNPHYIAQARAIAEHLDEEIHFEVGTLYENLSPGTEFDIVLALGLLYHLQYPFEAISKMAAIARNTLVIETEVASPYLDPSDSVFILDRYRDDPTNWWLPGTLAVCDALNDAGFEQVEVVPVAGAAAEPSYIDGFSDGFIQHGRRALFVANRHAGIRAFPVPHYADRKQQAIWLEGHPALVPDPDDPASTAPYRDLTIHAKQKATARFSLFSFADPSTPLATSAQELPASPDPVTLRWHMPLELLPPGEFVPVVSVWETNKEEPTDEILLPSYVKQGDPKSTTGQLFLQPHKWVIDGKPPPVTSVTGAIKTLTLTDSKRNPRDTFSPSEPFAIRLEFGNLAGTHLQRVEVSVCDTMGRQLALIDSDRIGLPEKCKDTATLQLRLTDPGLGEGCYQIQANIFGTTKEGPWNFSYPEDGKGVRLIIQPDHPSPWEHDPELRPPVKPPYQLVSVDHDPCIDAVDHPAIESIKPEPGKVWTTGKQAGCAVTGTSPGGVKHVLLEHKIETQAGQPRLLSSYRYPIELPAESEGGPVRFHAHFHTPAVRLSPGNYFETWTLTNTENEGNSVSKTLRIISTGACETGLIVPGLCSTWSGDEHAATPSPPAFGLADILDLKLLDESGNPATAFAPGSDIAVEIRLRIRDLRVQPALEVLIADADNYKTLLCFDTSTGGFPLPDRINIATRITLKEVALNSGNFVVCAKLHSHPFDEAQTRSRVLSRADWFAFTITGSPENAISRIPIRIEHLP